LHFPTISDYEKLFLFHHDPFSNSVTHLPPIVCFIGDSDRTVDPVLAQGITIGMEDASCVAKCVEHAFFVTDHRLFLEVVKEELIQRHQKKKEERLKCLVNATNLVQSLAQPSDKLSELVTRFIVRPFAVHVVPELIKRKCFHWVMNYSLGLSKKIM
jgi:2-polyprenyl-6-methoxyphenol hydroxylase-like FAD-dependent oxidoreductase